MKKIKNDSVDFTIKTKNLKKNKSDIEINNIIDDIQNILNPCIKCGMCKSLCPAFKSLRIEEVSPRGHTITLNEKNIDEFVFQCTLCKACEEKCPLHLKICDAILKAREVMILREKGLKTNKKMVEAIKKTGNPFGSGDNKDPDKLYCC